MTLKEQIIKKIHLIDGLEMSDELFKIKSEGFAEWLINTFGFEIIDRLDGIFPNGGEYWQLKYVA